MDSSTCQLQLDRNVAKKDTRQTKNTAPVPKSISRRRIGRMEVTLHDFLTSATDEGEYMLCFGCFTLGEISRYPLDKRFVAWVGAGGAERVRTWWRREKISLLPGIDQPGRSHQLLSKMFHISYACYLQLLWYQRRTETCFRFVSA